MAEYVPPGHVRAGSPAAHLDSTIIRRELYILLALVLADEAVMTAGPAISGLSDEFALSEILQRIVITATMIRARDDHFRDVMQNAPQWDRENLFGFRSAACGTLYHGGDDADPHEPLTMREACNKIIHAERTHFDLEPSTLGRVPVFRPFLYLYGTRGKSLWKAKIDLKSYVEAGVTYCVVS